MSVLGADSKLFRRGYGASVFKGCLGSCILIEKPDIFKEKYSEILTEACDKYSFQLNRPVCKSYDINKRLQGKSFKCLEFLFEKISKIPDTTISINYTTFNPSKTPEIELYRPTKTPKKQKIISFIDTLNNYYDYLCAWWLSSKQQLQNCNIYLDCFEGEITRAWQQLTKNNNVMVLPAGDQCNPYISFADIVTKFIDDKTSNERKKINDGTIEDIFKEYSVIQNHVGYIGAAYFNEIVPLLKRKINVYDQLKRPSVFVIKEEFLPEEKQWIENSPLYDRLLNFASAQASGLKFIDMKKDQRLIQPNDYLIYLGANGEKQAKFIKENLGYKIEIIQAKDI